MTSTATSTLADVIRLVPGYDPYAAAGDCRFDEEAALHVIGFFHDCLVHVKGEKAGEPFILEPWQQAIVANLFGWKRPDGTRRYREAFVFVARKNGKSSMAAGLALYMLFCDGEPGAEIYSAAAERDQAALVFDVAKRMVLAEPVLSTACRVYQKAITIESMGSSYKAISADANTKHGYNTHCAVIDELHAQRTRELVDVLMTSTGARRQPLIVHLTTSDFERESICNEKHDYACKVRDGIIEDSSFLPVIYEASIDDEWDDPEVWRKANPNLGVSVSEEYIAHECQRAQETPTFENTFKRLHLNIKTEQDVRWIRMADWDGCATPVDAGALKRRQCWGGLDLATISDLAAFVLVFPNDDGRYDVLPFFWCPRDNAHQRERRDRVPYLTWARQGLIELTPGNSIDYRHIRRRVNELGEKYRIVDIGYDPYNASHLATELGEEDGFELVQFRQGYLSMNEPTKELERLVINGQINHGGHAVLRWMAGNVTVKMDPAGNIKPDKQRSSEKIDGVVALIMAIGRAMFSDRPQRSVYESRGVLII